MMIYVLIAGTYTPVCLLALDGGWRLGLLGLIWGLACSGILLKLRWMQSPIWLSTALYVLPAWAALAAAPAVLRALPGGGLVWLVVGGLVYTLGALVYALGRPTLRPGVFEAHALWHLCVLAGSACHVWAVARYLTPLR
jgi:hemolysin III